MFGSLVAGVLIAMQVAAGANQDRLDRVRAGLQDVERRFKPTVSLTAPLVTSDGSKRGPAIAVTDAGQRFYVSSPHNSCEASISIGEPAGVRDAWRISTRIVSRDSLRSTTVTVEWQRLWSGGRPMPDGTSARTEIVLRSGDNVRLDQADIHAPGMLCHGQSRALELQVFGNVEVGPSDLPIAPPPSPMAMDVWLVHHTPAGVETTYPLTMTFVPEETRFTFRTQPITSHDGTFIVDVDGAVRTVRREDGTLGLSAGLRRMVRNTANAEVRLTAGSGGSVIEWGRPGEVISFDLPDLFSPSAGVSGAGRTGAGTGATGRGTAAGGTGQTRTHAAPELPPLIGHKFSVRLRFTPAR